MRLREHTGWWALAGLLAVSIAACSPSRGSTTSANHALTVSGLPVGTPEEVGMSSERLHRLSSAMQQLVDDRRLAGITTMVTRRGTVAHFETFGYRDIESGNTMSRDTIFRIYSMSKPLTGVALMMLYEEGKFRLSDPVERYIPEFKGLMVAAGEGPNGLIVEEADHPMTIRELMSHTAGLTYGLFSQSQVDAMYLEKNVLAFDGTLKDMINRLADLPLRQQPGSKWHYSVGVDVQGYLVELLSGQRFDQFLNERLFGPLEMVDTGFYVPPEKAERFAQIYAYGEDRGLTPPAQFDGARLGALELDSERVITQYLEPPTFLSGGGGMVSTTTDYMRFCQMLLNGGELDGVRILSPLTVDIMHRNQLPSFLAEPTPADGLRLPPGTGFGLNFAVVIDPVEAEAISTGEHYWMGAAGTWFWIDPAEELIFVGMIQQIGQGVPDVRSLSRRLTYQAILESASNSS